MIRQPTSAKALYAWHTAALDALSPDEEPPRHDGDPQCGWYLCQFKKGGPFLPVAIKMRREIDPETGELTCDEVIYSHWLGQDRRDAKTIWLWLKPISRARYNQLVATQFDAPSVPLLPSGKPDLTQEPSLP